MGMLNQYFIWFVWNLFVLFGMAIIVHIWIITKTVQSVE